MYKSRLRIGLHIFTTGLLIIGGLHYFLLAFKINLFGEINNALVRNTLYVFIGMSALYYIRMQTFLPFLGETVFPSALLREQPAKNYNTEYKLKNVPPNSIVIYWGSVKESNTAKGAYNLYENSGVTQSNALGVAKLRFRNPVVYSIHGRKLPRHIHYRYTLSHGMLSDVKTIDLDS